MATSRVLMVVRAVAVLVVVAAIVVQAIVLAQADRFDATRFFAFFTIQSNLIGVAAFAWLLANGDRPRSRALELLRGAAAVYLTVTFVVVILLLSDVDVQLQVNWAEFTLHKLFPIVVVLDWLVDPPRVSLGVSRCAHLARLSPDLDRPDDRSWRRGRLVPVPVPRPRQRRLRRGRDRRGRRSRSASCSSRSGRSRSATPGGGPWPRRPHDGRRPSDRRPQPPDRGRDDHVPGPAGARGPRDPRPRDERGPVRAGRHVPDRPDHAVRQHGHLHRQPVPPVRGRRRPRRPPARATARPADRPDRRHRGRHRGPSTRTRSPATTSAAAPSSSIPASTGSGGPRPTCTTTRS